ncbi:mitochondrial matrix iron-sulfur protein [Dispira parvispora]|uniref:Mitochondrial matrix iron-sulfur protein n=1 Tax=Dispira parvispora TaxID=1520584 RepID=A0A9W8E6D2_9FUNG|nr:mitochondrial matrix iron-sulfur protein [Dispira parvispora]
MSLISLHPLKRMLPPLGRFSGVSVRHLGSRSYPNLRVTRLQDYNSSALWKMNGTRLTVTFVTPEGQKKTVRCNEGDSLLEIAHANNIDLEGACEASLACSTCHVILDENIYDQLEEPSDEENDMLDLAFGLTETSRLGCQVRMCKDMDGMTVYLPSATRNMAVDGFKPKPH